MLDKRGIAVYLGTAFLLAIVLAVGGSALGWDGLRAPGGISLATLALAAWIPAAAAFAGKRAGGTRIESRAWPIPPLRFVAALLLAPAGFVILFLILSLLGLATPDWDVNQLAAYAPESGPDGAADIPPAFLLSLAFVATLLVLPVLHTLALFGHEWGWRGYLLPRLLPLGRLRAHALVAALWIAWLAILAAPHIGGWLFLRMLLLAGCFGVVLNEMWRCARHHGLTAVALGAFTANILGVWPHLFPNANPPWGGVMGGGAIALWGAIALMAAAAGIRRKDEAAEAS